MSEEKTIYKTNSNHYNTEVLWLAKRLKNLIYDTNKLDPNEQSNVIKRLKELDYDLFIKLEELMKQG